jgi:DnaJ-class molecular chaperone
MQDLEERVEMKCKRCAGTGKRQELDLFGGANFTYVIDCPTCDGTGIYRAIKDD